MPAFRDDMAKAMSSQRVCEEWPWWSQKDVSAQQELGTVSNAESCRYNNIDVVTMKGSAFVSHFVVGPCRPESKHLLLASKPTCGRMTPTSWQVDIDQLVTSTGGSCWVK